MDKITEMACRRCGSHDVRRDAWAVWNSKDSCWELGEIFDAAFCADCDGECSIVEIETEMEG